MGGPRFLEAMKTHTAVAKAIKAGELVRPKRCEECGKKKRIIHGAHHDYGRPLDVRWLCVSCHKKWDLAVPKNSGFAEWGGQLVFRISPKDKKALEAEAEREKLGLSAYVRRLILFNPARSKK